MTHNHHDRYPMHLSACRGDPRGREAAQEVIYEAVQMLKTKHEVADRAAFVILVKDSADSRTSVRDTARRLLAATPTDL